MEEQDLTWFLSIDPGFKNCGYSVGFYKVYEKDGLIKLMIVDKGVAPLIYKENLHNPLLLYSSVKSFVKNLVEQHPYVKICFVEGQYFNTWGINQNIQRLEATIALQNIQMALTASITSHNIKLFFVNSSVYKKQLKIACGNYNENKKKVLEFVKKLGVENITHHEADTIAQVYWWVKVKYETYYKKDFELQFM